jgi:hypothetical protein
MYKRFSVEVIQEQKRSHTLMLSRLSKVAVIFKNSFFNDFFVPDFYLLQWIIKHLT